MPRPRKQHTILAIDPGTRELGFAVLDGDRLLYHGVKTIESQDSPRARLDASRKLVARMFRDFGPGVLAIERTFFSKNRNASLLNVLDDEIVAMAKRRKVKVVRLAASTVKKAVTGNGHATKREVAEAVIDRYPDLRAYFLNGRKWVRKYQANMFDAVAIGLAAQMNDEGDD